MPQLYSPGETAFVLDNSQYVPAPSSDTITIFTTASRGPVGIPTLITNVNDLYTTFGLPDYSKLTYGIYAARNYLTEGNSIWMVRVEHTGSATLNLKVPVAGVIAGLDGTSATMFVATAKSEGDWINGFSITVTSMNATAGLVSFTVSDASGVLETFSQVDLATIDQISSSYFNFTVGAAGPFTAPTIPTTYTTAGAAGTLGADNFNTAAVPAVVTTPGVSAIVAVQDGTATPKTVFTATRRITGVSGNLDSIDLTYFNDVADIVSFDVKINGVVVESFNSVAIATVGTLTSAYFTFANVDVTPFVAPTIPTSYTSASIGGTLGVDEVVSFAAMPAPYTDTDTVAGWISAAAGLDQAVANKDMYPCDKLCAPGYATGLSSATRQTWSDLVSLVETRGDCFLISEISRGLTAASAVAERAMAGVPTSTKASAPYYPWLTMWDSTLRQNIVLPPACFMAGVYARNDRLGYKWTAPAGMERGVINAANGLESTAQVTGPHQDILYPAFINTITHDVASRMILTNGQKSLVTAPSKLDRVNVDRLVIMISQAAEKYMKSFRFEPNVASTWRRAEGGMQAYLDDLVARSALEVAVATCDATTNTAVRRDRNELWIDLHVIPVGAAEFIYIPISIHRSGDL